jgi:hypothetical protein
VRYNGIGFIEGGALLNVLPGDAFYDRILARNLTGAYIPDEISPEVYTWSLAIQREIYKRLTVETRYVGTRGIRLPIQRWVSARIPNPFRLPTFANASEIPSSFAGQPTLSDFLNNRDLLLWPFGFQGVITEFAPEGRSSYHGASVSVRGNLPQGVFINSSFTWSKTIDLIENELFTSFMNPRRPWDMLNSAESKGLSGLHREHKFVFSWSWNIPGFSGEQAFLRGLTRGWNLSGTFLAESGQPLTGLARRDTNGDFDTAGDRAFVNFGASGSLGTDVTAVCFRSGFPVSIGCSPAALGLPAGTSMTRYTVAYVANDPNARYIRPGTGSYPAGSLSQLGRNTLFSPGINNWNMSVYKDTPFRGEGRVIRFQADFVNVFNHPSYVIGNGSVFGTTAVATTLPGFVTPGVPDFLDKTILSGGLGQAPFQRVIQLSVRVMF